MRAAAPCLAALALGCAEPTASLEIEDDGAELYFVLRLRAASVLERLGPFARTDLARGVRAEADERVWVLGLDRDALEAAIVGYDVEHETAMTLEIEPGPELASYAGEVARLAVPRGSALYENVGEASARRDYAAVAGELPLSLAVPVRADWCRDASHERLVPFGPSERLLPADVALPIEAELGGIDAKVPVRGLRKVAWLDEDRVVALSSAMLFVLERGRAPTIPERSADPSEPAEAIALWRLAPGGALSVKALAVDPRPSARGTRVLLAGGVGSGDAERPAVWEVVIDGLSARVVGTASIAGPPRRGGLEDIAIGANGAELAVGEGAMVLLRDAPDDPFRAPDQRGAFGEEELSAAAVIRGFAEPHAIASLGGTVHFGNAARGNWPISARPGVQTFHAEGIRQDAQTLDVWIGGNDATLVRRRAESDVVEPVELRAGPRFAACAQLDRFTTGFMDVAPEDGELYLILNDCSAPLRVAFRGEEPCVTPLLAGGEPAHAQDDLAGIDVRGGGVVAVGGEGRVLVRE